MLNNRDHLLTKGYPHNKLDVQTTVTSLAIVCTRVSDFDLWWPHITSMKNNKYYLLTKCYLHSKFEVQATFTSWLYRVYKVFILGRLVTSNDLWPQWKTIEIVHLPSVTYMLRLKFKKLLFLEISCLQANLIGIIYSLRATNLTQKIHRRLE